MHPLTGLVTVSLFIIQLLIIRNPIVILTTTIIFLIVLSTTKNSNLLRDNFKIAKYPMLMVLIINPIIVGLGNTVFMSFKAGPIVVKITLECILYSLMMSIKLFIIIIAFQLFSKITQKEDLFTFMNKYCRQLTLTLSMSSNAIDALKAEYERVQMVMFTRGMPLNEKSLKLRLKHSVYLIKVVFISVLESTFLRSEALYVRKYTKQAGSEYQPLRFRIVDKLLLIIQLILTVGIGIASIQGSYTFQYYPYLSGNINYETLLLISVSLISILFGIKEQNKHEQLLFN